MSKIAYLECARCGRRLSAETPQTVCPLDAGVLYVRYDMDDLRRSARRDRPAELAAAFAGSLGMWRYADVLPDADRVTLGEGWTPMRQSRRFPGLHIKDEGANPTGTCEARGIGLAVTMAKRYGLKHVAAASTGVAAGALAAYAAAGELSAHIFIPQDVPQANYLESIICGADVTVVEGLISDSARQLAERITQQRESGVPAEEVWLDMSTFKEPFHLEGTKTMGYELVEQLGWEYPDAVLCPTGDGAEIIGMWKAFEEMEQLGWVSGKRPRMFAIQAPGCIPCGDSVLLDIVRKSGGSAVVSGEAEVMASLLDWAKEEGLFLCPDGAAATAGYGKLLALGEIKSDERVVLFNPSAGLKYTDTIAKAMHLHRPGSLPKSLPVGGIITPV